MPFAPPATVPFSAAIDIPLNCATLNDNSSQRVDSARPFLAASRSAPALKTVPLPVKISPCCPSAVSTALHKSCSICSVKAFAFSGRLSVMSVVLSCC